MPGSWRGDTCQEASMPTIALVDDDRNILTSVSIALEAEGYRTMTYTDGSSALDGFKLSPPDLAHLGYQDASRRFPWKTGAAQNRPLPARLGGKPGALLPTAGCIAV